MIESPKLWWSQSAAEARGHASGGVLEEGAGGRPETPLPPFEGEPLDEWPADVVPFELGQRPPPTDRDVDSTVLAALVVAVSEIDWDYPLLRAQIIRLTQRAVMRTLRAEGYLPPGREQQDDEVSEQRRIRAASDDLDRALTALQAGWEAEAREHVDEIDEKSRGPAYRRGYADGRLAERAGLAWGEQCSRVEAFYVGSPTDPPPFAPELADAPLVTGESGAAGPLVVDHPVHESTLPAELERDEEGDG